MPIQVETKVPIHAVRRDERDRPEKQTTILVKSTKMSWNQIHPNVVLVIGEKAYTVCVRTLRKALQNATNQ